MTLMERLGFKKPPEEPRTEARRYGSLDRIVFSCSYLCSGGMLGVREEYSLVRRESGEKKLTYRYRRSFDHEESSGEMEPSEELFEEILRIYKGAGVRGFGELETSDMIIHDAPFVSVDFRVDGIDTRICGTDIIPDQGRSLIGDVRDAFYNYIFK